MMTFFKSKFFKWGALGFSGLLLLSVVGVYAASEFRINRVYDVQPPAITIPSDAAAIAEGERLFNVRGCIDCHGENGAGSIMIDDPALGRIVSSNLTPANSEINRQYSDLD